MTITTRFLTGSLAAVAVASAVTLAAPAAQADEQPARPCGQPAVAAVYTTVVHDPELRVVPAVTHDEWLWQRDVTTDEFEFSKVLAAAYDEIDWVRDVPGTTEYLWSHKVVDHAAVPAVPGTPEQGHFETVVVTPAVTVTMFEYVQQQTGKTRWERDGWNGEHDDEDKGKGWAKTGNTRVDVVTPAVTAKIWVVDQPAFPGVPGTPEVSHTETAWSATSPGGDWTGPLDTRIVGGGTETATTTDGNAPAGDGWSKTATHHHDAVVDVVWALEAPAGYTPTGASRVHDVSTETTPVTSAAAPAGDGWSQVADSHVVVVDVPEHTELVGEGWSEQVLLSPALDATAPCPTTSGDSVASPTVAPATGAHQHHQHAASAAAAAPSATVLPETGNPTSPWLLAMGAGALAAGGALVRVGRRRSAL